MTDEPDKIDVLLDAEPCLRPPHDRCAYASADGLDACKMQCALRHPAVLP